MFFLKHLWTIKQLHSIEKHFFFLFKVYLLVHWFLNLQILLCTFKSILIFCLYCELNLLLALKSINSFLLTLCERIYSSNLCTLRGYEGLLEPWSSSVNSLKPIAIKALKIVNPYSMRRWRRMDVIGLSNHYKKNFTFLFSQYLFTILVLFLISHYFLFSYNCYEIVITQFISLGDFLNLNSYHPIHLSRWFP